MNRSKREIRQTRISFVTTIPLDAILVISSVKAMNEKIADDFEICVRTDGDFRDFRSMRDR